ncbi:MAG: magnesium/cobalt transporter CorA [Candidatus Pedobacter colombiensis]|uniref:Magnesium transport protein CorA n=1 Tax=Candidatus Pedobacter colombiensis TaxID=3121371 RepID=A0AAJ5WBF0_9SPHI|nr:magnesium/cobalt transporter CorA [Pedobacter sp.]WEK21472.1 MAG: magnesium/cobalt transporter CorA [Pedobacter sp.]
MSKSAKHKRKRKNYSLRMAGSSPGIVYIDEQALKPIIIFHTYNDYTYEVKELDNIENLSRVITNSEFNYWIEIKGLGSLDLFETLNNDFGINRLILEDITTPNQRPKLEEYGKYDFAISRMLHFDEQKNMDNDQVSFILMQNTLFTFQEGYKDCLDPVRARLIAGKGNIRIAGSSYLMYAIMDIIIDTYFVILGAWGEELDLIEDRLFDKPDRSVMYDTQRVKRNLINVRRVVWPERDKLSDILRSDSLLIPDQTKMYIRDAYDHCIQIIDMVESLKEISASNIDMYLSIISNRMNEIMKVLTIISSIFIPLTFIAGIYGMNFASADPITGKLLPQNMPELYKEHGYLYTIIVMGLIAILQIIYFWRKGWFK